MRFFRLPKLKLKVTSSINTGNLIISNIFTLLSKLFLSLNYNDHRTRTEGIHQ